MSAVALVAGILLGGPIGTGNLYLTKVDANGGVGVGLDTPAAAPAKVCLGTGSDGSSRGCDNPTLLLGNVKIGSRSRSSTAGVSKRLIKRTGVGI